MRQPIVDLGHRAPRPTCVLVGHGLTPLRRAVSVLEVLAEPMAAERHPLPLPDPAKPWSFVRDPRTGPHVSG